MKTKKMLALAATLALCLSAAQMFAQNDPQQGGDRPQRNRGGGNQQDGGGQGGQGGQGGGRGNFDPAQMQQRMLDRAKEQLEITDDTEWKAIEPLVKNVNDARFASMAGGFGRGGFGRGNRGGGNQQDAGGAAPGMPANPERDALQKAIDAKAPASELKAAMDKYVAARKAKQAELDKAQAALRKVLTPRQEAIAALNGLL